MLQTLVGAPFEPIFTADLKWVTLKTVFLIALASAKRVSELQGLSGDVSHAEDWSSISLTFAVDFLAKTEVPSTYLDQDRSFSLPALSSVASDAEDLKLCPVRALRAYLVRTRNRRPPNSRLFLPLSGDRPAVSKNTISFWIRTVIKRAYGTDGAAAQRTHGRSAHEVRALSTSWAFVRSRSLASVMAAASWRSHTTFSNHYLRDVSSLCNDTYHLGPLIVAQHLLPSSQNERGGGRHRRRHRRPLHPRGG